MRCALVTGFQTCALPLWCFALAFDPLSPEPARRFDAAEGRHFYGHGVFSPDGRWLFACENDYDNARGCIGVYDAAAGYRRESELEAHAIGPNETSEERRGGDEWVRTCRSLWARDD